ncbi:MAG: HD domain-containing protein [Syntrophobacteraceae bacterium]|nr:HD domain-containing protein [Syntrophobacteraceae bacterium]
MAEIEVCENSGSVFAAATDGVHLFNIDEFRSRMEKSLGPSSPDNGLFFEALDFASELHEGQRRKSGAPYISHPCAVAEIMVREMRFKDPVLLAAALLHDVVEDIPWMSVEDIETRFGAGVAELVDGCTKLARFHLDRALLKDLTHSKIFISASRRLGVLIIKLADRLHNLRTLHYLPLTKRQRIAQETVDVYAPIAARLNLYPLKRELYHHALTFLYPKKSKKILHLMQELRNSPAVASLEASLLKILSDSGVPADIRTRAKGLGSYYNPVKRTLDSAYPENFIDFAVLLRTEELSDCYRVLGLVNNNLSVIPKSLRDFIANPKANGYRSLHTRVHLSGNNYLIKIRNLDMESLASGGVLRAWESQEGLSNEHWQDISDLLRDIGEYEGGAMHRKALIRLSESEEIYTYSPVGDIYYLPKASIVLDFAYRIHSELGDSCEGAMVNGAWMPITGQLKDGDTVEILTSAEQMDVDTELEALCKTPKARTAINRRLHQKRLLFARQAGMDILLQQIVRHKFSASVLEGENMRLILEILNVKDLQELYLKIGQDLVSPQAVLYYLEGHRPDEAMKQKEAEGESRNTLAVRGLDKAIFKFARCCNPLPGQDHVLATLSERGVTFHHRDCRDLQERHSLLVQQMLQVHWVPAQSWRHPLAIDIQVQDSTMKDMLPLLSTMPERSSILQITGGMDKHNRQFVSLRVRFHNFSETREFFSRMPAEKTMVEDFGREGKRNDMRKP